MSGPTELSFDEILKFMLAHNGKVTNHELVKYFKVFLTNPDMRDEARSTFKKHVNALANIKNNNNEKWLILKKKYMPCNGKDNHDLSTEKVTDSSSTPALEASVDDSNVEVPPERPPLPLHLNQDLTLLNSIIQDNSVSNTLEQQNKTVETITPQCEPIEEEVPAIILRGRSSLDNNGNNDKIMPLLEPKPLVKLLSSTSDDNVSIQLNETLSPSKSESMLLDSEHTISVKERKQMFNRMASEGDILKPQGNFNTSGTQEEDRASVNYETKSESDPLDSKQKAWILCAARGEYYALAKMCSENAKLAKTKDPFTTAMHWACKRGDENLVKLLAGVTRAIVNERSGYTPLHIAMQFRHENIFRLLLEVYGADPNILDWSGRKPRQYLIPMDTSLSPGSYRNSDSLRKTMTAPPTIRVTPNVHTLHNMHSKKEGFLRIGSLNVRVKKTTEAFSNFLGVGATRSSGYMPKSARGDAERRVSEDLENIHKNWGSADNIPKEDKLMLPPLSNKVRRRGASGRKGLAAHSRSTPSTPDQSRAHIGVNEEGDSDSDSAAGFHAAWRQQRASDCL